MAADFSSPANYSKKGRVGEKTVMVEDLKLANFWVIKEATNWGST